MSHTLLNGVNDVLTRVHIVAGDATLSSLTDSSKQNAIDVTVQMWNEAIDELYSTARLPKPTQLGETTITLATSTRNYVLPTDLLRVRWPLLDETNGRYIVEYPDGYMQMISDQPFPANYTGVPFNATVRPTDGELYLDRSPTSKENGLVYKLRYDKELVLSLATDTFPFKDVVYRAMVPAVAQLFNGERKGKFDEAVFNASIGRASRYLIETQPRGVWAPYRISMNITDPMESN